MVHYMMLVICATCPFTKLSIMGTHIYCIFLHPMLISLDF